MTSNTSGTKGRRPFSALPRFLRTPFWFVAALLPVFPVGAASSSDSLVPLAPQDWPALTDDGRLEGLAGALTQSVVYYRSLPPDRPFRFGGDVVPASRLAASLETALALLETTPPDRFPGALKERFTLYRAGGGEAVTFSAYYEHSLPASLVRSDEYRYPLYGRPPDLVERESPTPGAPKTAGRTVDGRFVPYLARAEIDSGGALAGKGLEIAWAKDPVDIYFLQVQGSGWLELPDGRRLRVRYAANNGHPYTSVGTTMIKNGLIARETFSRDIMVKYLRDHPRERQAILNANARYVFFQTDDGPTAHEVYGALRVPLTARRSVAVDPAVYPPGALAWMSTEGEVPATRFVVCQDEGGAIKGPGRVDFFTGDGAAAEAFAVRFWRAGHFYFLLEKPAEGK